MLRSFLLLPFLLIFVHITHANTAFNHTYSSYNEDDNENDTFDIGSCIDFSHVNISVPKNEQTVQNLQIVIYSIVLVVGTIGNLLVIYVILVNKKLKTVTNTYLLNLAVADLIYLQGIPFYLVTLIKQQWIFQIILCKIYWIFTGINQFTGIFILTVLAFDRYLAVCHPVAAINWRKIASSRIILLIVWLISIFVMIPVILYSDVDSVVLPTHHFTELNNFTKPPPLLLQQQQADNLTTTPNHYDCIIKPTCTIKWPEKSIIKTEVAFVVYGFIISFFCPVTLISVFYFNVVLRLKRGSKLHNNSSERQRARRKVTILVLTVISVYILTFAPFWIFQVALTAYYINKYEISEYFHQVTAHLSSFFQFLLYLNSALNPYLYAFLSEIFRNSFKTVITNPFICCTNKGTMHFPRRESMLASRINRLKSISLNDTKLYSLNVNAAAQVFRLKGFNKRKGNNNNVTNKKILEKKFSLDHSLYHSQAFSPIANDMKPTNVAAGVSNEIEFVFNNSSSGANNHKYERSLNIITEAEQNSQANV